MAWAATILTLFPDIFPGPLGASIIGRARKDGLWRLETLDIRDFSRDKHRSVDDAPAGGGPGMVMRADILADAIDAVPAAGRPLIYLSPRGRPIDQAFVRDLAQGPGAVLICGRFEGVDERVLQARRVQEASLGDFVLAGGETAAMALIEASVRLLPGVLGAPASARDESFENGLLEYPQYTRPRTWEGREIPDILLSGDHKRIDDWRRRQAIELTRARRPDLWAARGEDDNET
ncbi:MAG: tRNA (guanosine(37)-N1)-methyltransferase TrmD [Pseudomonadota bacterium]